MTGQELRALRKAAGLTQEECVRMLGIKSAVTWSRWERGRTRIDDLKAQAIRAFLERVARDNRGAPE